MLGSSVPGRSRRLLSCPLGVSLVALCGSARLLVDWSQWLQGRGGTQDRSWLENSRQRLEEEAVEFRERLWILMARADKLEAFARCACLCRRVFCRVQNRELEKRLAALRTEDARGAVAPAASSEGNPFGAMAEDPVSELKVDPSVLELEARLC